MKYTEQSTSKQRFKYLICATILCLALSANVSLAEEDSTTSITPILSIPSAPVDIKKKMDEQEKAREEKLQEPTINAIYEAAHDPFGDEFKWLPVSDSDWNAVSIDSTESTDALTIFAYRRTVDKPRGDVSVMEVYYRRKIFNSIGKDSYADINYTFFDRYFDSLQIQGRTILPDGRTIPLDTSLVIRKSIQTPEGADVTSTSFSLPGVTDSCIIEYYMRYLTYEGSTHWWYYQSEIPILSAKYFWYPAKSILEKNEFVQMILELLKDEKGVIDFTLPTPSRLIPDKRSTAYAWQNTVGKATTNIVPENSPSVLVFAVTDVPPFEPEPYSIPEELQQSRVVMYRTQLDNTKKYWESMAKQYDEALTHVATKKKKLLKAIKKIKKKIPRDEWPEAAYNWTQQQLWNSDYNGWYSEKYLAKQTKKRKRKSISRRKRKSKKNKEFFIDDLINRRDANSTGVNLLFCEALKAMGFNTHMAYVVNRDSTVFSSSLPTWQFDRTIVLVQTDSAHFDAYDPSTPYLAPGQLRWQNEGVAALIIGDTKRLFVHTPVSSQSENTISRSLSVKSIDEDGWSASSKERYGGQMATTLRETLWRHDEEYHVQEVKRMLFPEQIGVEIDSLQISGLWDRGGPIVMTFNIRKRHEVAGGGKRLFLPLKEFFGESYNPFTKETRLKPLVFDFPYTVTDIAVIHLNEQWSLQAKPDDMAHTNKFGSCQSAIKSIGDVVSLQRLFRITSPYVGKKHYQDIRDIFNARQELNNQIISLIKSQ